MNPGKGAAFASIGRERPPETSTRPSGRSATEACWRPNAITADQLGAFLSTMRKSHPQHVALATVLAYTGLCFCHASALRWEDMDEDAGVLHVRRRQVRGDVRPVSRRKRAPRQVPLVPELTEVLRTHRQRLLGAQAPGLEEGWMFPSRKGTLRTPGGLWKAWRVAAAAAGIQGRFTVHGLRRTFNDLSRRAGADAVVIRSITGHVTERMREHYSTVDLAEKQAVVAGVVKLVAGGRDQGRDSTRK